MSCCTCEDDSENPLKHEGWSDLTEMKRGCTDVLHLILILATWFAMTMVGLIVLGAIKDPHLQSGNPVKLTHAVDYDGRVCGYSSVVKSSPYAYYLPDQSCVCVDECPSTSDYYKFYCRGDTIQKEADSSTAKGYAYVANKQCMYQIKTYEYLNRCWPDISNHEQQVGASAASGSNSTSTYKASQSSLKWFNSLGADIVTLRGYIGGFGLGISTVLAFCYLYFLRIPGLLFLLTWGCILAVLALLVLSASLVLSLASSWKAEGVHPTYEVVTMQVFGAIIFGAAFLYFCACVFMRKQIMLAIGIIKQAAKALTALPTLLALPVAQAIGITIFMVPWTFYVIYLASSGEMKTYTSSYTNDGMTYNYSYREFEYTQNSKFAFLFLLFCWFWTSEFIIAVGQLIIALSFSTWYFTRDKSTIGPTTVIGSARAVIIHHLGTAAHGSLIIAIIKTIRAVIAYIQKKARDSKNKLLEYIMCCIDCLLWCLEKCMKFINKHAYIITAIFAYSFCHAARKAFFLLLRNILRVSAVSMVSGFVLLIGKLLIPISTTFLAYLVISYGSNTNSISGIIAPLVLIYLLAYWIGFMFIEIFAMGIETILFCFIADEEMFEPEKRFASGDLVSTVQAAAQSAADQNVIVPAYEVEVKGDKGNIDKPSGQSRNFRSVQAPTDDDKVYEF